MQDQILRHLESLKSQCADVNNLTPLEDKFLTAGLKSLYAPSEHPVYFYAQDPSGFPCYPADRVQNTLEGKEFHPQVLHENVIAAHGALNNRTIEELLGNPSTKEECAVCDHCDTAKEAELRSRCDCSYEVWAADMFDNWTERTYIQKDPNKGYCLFARKPIKQHTAIGEYTGQLLSNDDDVTADAAAYWSELLCNETPGKKKSKPKKAMAMWGSRKKMGNMSKAKTNRYTCVVDGAEHGSIMRFMSHSFWPNAYLTEARVGRDRYVVSVVSSAPIEPGEEITIAYGEDGSWFDDDEYCYCGVDICKKPPPESASESDDAMETEE